MGNVLEEPKILRTFIRGCGYERLALIETLKAALTLAGSINGTVEDAPAKYQLIGMLTTMLGKSARWIGDAEREFPEIAALLTAASLTSDPAADALAELAPSAAAPADPKRPMNRHERRALAAATRKLAKYRDRLAGKRPADDNVTPIFPGRKP